MSEATTKTLWKAQQWDPDAEEWEDMDHEGAEGCDRYQVEQEARYEANRCAHKVRTRVVRA